MRYDLYSRTNQQLLDGAIVGTSFYCACLIAYAGDIPIVGYRLSALLLAVVAGRLLINFLFGLHRIQWRYIGFHDAFRTAQAYLAFSFLLLLLRLAVPAKIGISRLPIGVITIDFLLALLGAMSIRILRRYIYEVQSKQKYRSHGGQRRVLLVGAGIMGAQVARDMASDPSIEIVGFLDDDSSKIGGIIAGIKVLGPTSMLTEIVQDEQVDSVLICISSRARGSFNRLVAVLDSLPVTSRFVPTITEILDDNNGFHHGVPESTTSGNGHHPQAGILRMITDQARAEIKNKTILITGGAGFIGSSLAQRLVADNNVILLDRFFHNQPVTFTSVPKHPNVRMIVADILDGNAIDDLAHEAQIVVHAAAIVGVGRVCSYPRETLETNFGGTLRVLKAFEKSRRLERFVYFSTSEVFGVNSFRVHEHTPTAVGPAAEARWSYAIAKLAGEHLVKAYHRQGGMPVVTVRPFNVFGPRRLGSNAVSTFILNSLQGSPIEVHGDGSQIRSWCYIEDFCDALIEMIARPQAVGEDFNIGNPKNTVTIFQLAQLVLEVTSRHVPITFTDSGFPDIEIRVPSLDKARQILDFAPAYDLRRSLELTVEWYRQNIEFFEKKTARAHGAAVGH